MFHSLAEAVALSAHTDTNINHSSSELKILLTPYVLRHLDTNNIRTCVQFVQHDVNKLKVITNLPANQIVQLKALLLLLFGPDETDGRTVRDHRMLDTFVLPTGLDSLDKVLGGGLLTGSLIELSGCHGAGKTLLADSIAVHMVRTHGVRVYCVSTKNACSAMRWYQLLKAGEADSGDVEDIGNAMSRIRYDCVSSVHELLRMVRQLLANPVAHADCRLLFVDSLTVPLMSFQGATNKIGRSLMNEALTLLRQLAVQQQKIVLLETLVLSDPPIHHDETRSAITSTISRFWTNFFPIRLYVQKMGDEQPAADGRHSCEVKLLKSNQHKSGVGVSCMLHLGGWENEH